MIITKDDIYLMQPRHLSSTLPPNFAKTCPIITIKQPQWPENESFAPPHDRLNYSTQIPELGVILVGTPAGQVAVVRLVKEVLEKGSDPIYSLKIDHILSGRSVASNAGYVRMVGFAVGPVQGMLDLPADDSDVVSDGGQAGDRLRRWRIMLHFQDHTVVTYELGRHRNDVDASITDLVI